MLLMGSTPLTFGYLTDGGVVKFKGLFGVRLGFRCEMFPNIEIAVGESAVYFRSQGATACNC